MKLSPPNRARWERVVTRMPLANDCALDLAVEQLTDILHYCRAEGLPVMRVVALARARLRHDIAAEREYWARERDAKRRARLEARRA